MDQDLRVDPVDRQVARDVDAVDHHPDQSDLREYDVSGERAGAVGREQPAQLFGGQRTLGRVPVLRRVPLRARTATLDARQER